MERTAWSGVARPVPSPTTVIELVVVAAASVTVGAAATTGVVEDDEVGRGADPLWARAATPVAATMASAPRTNRGRLVMVISTMPPFGFTPAHETSERDGSYATARMSRAREETPAARRGLGDVSEPARDVDDDVRRAVGVVDVDLAIGCDLHHHQVGYRLPGHEVEVGGSRLRSAIRPDSDPAVGSGVVRGRHVDDHRERRCR